MLITARFRPENRPTLTSVIMIGKICLSKCSIGHQICLLDASLGFTEAVISILSIRRQMSQIVRLYYDNRWTLGDPEDR